MQGSGSRVQAGCAVPLGDAVGREVARGGEPGFWGSGFGVWGVGFRDQGGLGVRVRGLGSRGNGLGFWG